MLPIGYIAHVANHQCTGMTFLGELDHHAATFVYLAPNTELGALSEYLQMAKDNQADSISTSWGISCEFFVNSQVTLAENQIFLQMAAQGQSIFAASGDAGAYGCSRVGILPPAGQELQLGDPNNQPYITAVGLSLIHI